MTTNCFMCRNLIDNPYIDETIGMVPFCNASCAYKNKSVSQVCLECGMKGHYKYCCPMLNGRRKGRLPICSKCKGAHYANQCLEVIRCLDEGRCTGCDSLDHYWRECPENINRKPLPENMQNKKRQYRRSTCV